MSALRHKLLDTALILFPGIVFVGLWEVGVHNSTRLQFLFASPSAIFARGIDEYQHAAIWEDIGITTFEAMTGLVLGSVFGIVIALLLWVSPFLQKISYPYIALIGSIPVFALAPMLIIWFGIGIMAKVIMAAFGVFIITLVQGFEGISATAPDHIRYARMVHARSVDIMFKILLPSAMQWLITALRINIGVAFLGAFIGEFISSQTGLGHYIIEAGQLYDMPGVLFGILNLSLLALIIDKGIRLNTCCMH